MKHNIRKCCSDDLVALYELSRKTYSDTFAHMNTPANMQAYLEKAFSSDRLRGELADDNSAFYFLDAGNEICGYFKLNEQEAQTDVHDPQSLEIERIYVKQECQGNGWGHILINEAVKIAASRGKQYVWLGVWEQNGKAIRFYQKNGFYIAGTHPFVMGEETQTDFIMRKDLI